MSVVVEFDRYWLHRRMQEPAAQAAAAAFFRPIDPERTLLGCDQCGRSHTIAEGCKTEEPT